MKAENFVTTPILMSDWNTLMPLEIEMCEEIFNTWEINIKQIQIQIIY